MDRRIIITVNLSDTHEEFTLVCEREGSVDYYHVEYCEYNPSTLELLNDVSLKNYVWTHLSVARKGFFKFISHWVNDTLLQDNDFELRLLQAIREEVKHD